MSDFETALSALSEEQREMYRAAAAASDAIYDAHRTDIDADFMNVDYLGRVISYACICEREFTTPNGRGLHIAAMQRRAADEFSRVVADARTAEIAA